MKFLQFIVIIGIFSGGQYALGSKLPGIINFNRKLMVKGGADDTSAFVYFAAGCTVTRISAEKVAADSDKCGGGFDYCKEPTDAPECGDDKVNVKDGNDMQGVTVYEAAGEDAPETGSDFSNECVVIGYGDAEKQTNKKTNGGATAADGGESLTITMEEGKELCPGDNGGALVCAGKLVGVIGKVEACGGSGTAVKIQNLLGGAGDENASDGGDGSTTPGSKSSIVTPSMILTVFPIIVITSFTL